MTIDSNQTIKFTYDAYKDFVALYDKIDQIYRLRNKDHDLQETL